MKQRADTCSLNKNDAFCLNLVVELIYIYSKAVVLILAYYRQGTESVNFSLNLQTWAPFMTIQYFPHCFWIFLYVFALPTLTELYPKVNLFLDVARGMARGREWGSEAEQPGGAPSWEMPLLAWPSLSRPSSFLLPQVGPTVCTQSPLQWYSLPAPVSWWRAWV